MAYSRWSSSRWYTFWAYDKPMEYNIPTKILKDQQIFEICDIPTFCITYGQIKRDGIFKTLMDVKKFYDEPSTVNVLTKLDSGEYIYEDHSTCHEPVSFKELQELKTYIEMFITDVDEHFEPYNFFVYEWYYPMRNSIHASFTTLKERLFKNSN